MKAKHVKNAGWFLGCMFALGVYLVFCGVSWIIVCGIIKLITMCFGWSFNWMIATGVWLLMWLVRAVFSNTITVKK